MADEMSDLKDRVQTIEDFLFGGGGGGFRQELRETSAAIGILTDVLGLLLDRLEEVERRNPVYMELRAQIDAARNAVAEVQDRAEALAERANRSVNGDEPQGG
jgi:hypothetical protein